MSYGETVILGVALQNSMTLPRPICALRQHVSITAWATWKSTIVYLGDTAKPVVSPACLIIFRRPENGKTRWTESISGTTAGTSQRTGNEYRS